jgi:hypothetical protein
LRKVWARGDGANFVNGGQKFLQSDWKTMSGRNGDRLGELSGFRFDGRGGTAAD